jgi:methyl coenzyme M reductase subunit C
VDNEEYEAAYAAENSSKGVPTDPIARRKIKLRVESAHVHKIVAHKNYVLMIQRFVSHFDDKLRLFVQSIRCKTERHSVRYLYSTPLRPSSLL